MAATPMLNNSVRKGKVLTISVQIQAGKPTVKDCKLVVFRGSEVQWICDTPGDMCISFNASAYPIAFSRVDGAQTPTLGPFPIVGPCTPGKQFRYTIGWRGRSDEPYQFTDPVIIVDTPDVPGARHRMNEE
jgi:hypothetical protein